MFDFLNRFIDSLDKEDEGDWRISLIDNGLCCQHSNGVSEEYFEGSELEGEGVYSKKDVDSSLSFYDLTDRLIKSSGVFRRIYFEQFFFINHKDNGYILRGKIGEKDLHRYFTNDTLKNVPVMPFLNGIKNGDDENNQL